MEVKPIITWKDVIKLTIGIMFGLTGSLLIIIGISDNGSISYKHEINNTIYDESYYKEYYAVPTVEDILNERKELRYALWVDSVYMTMPEDTLTQILVLEGTQLSVEKIVEEYLSFKRKNNTTSADENE